MSKQAKVVKEAESAAAATLKPNPTRAQMLATFTQLLAQLGQEDLTHFYNDAVAQIGHEADNIPDGAAASNAATIAAKEDIDQIFAGESELSEEFKDKAKTIFESLVEAHVVLVRAKLEEEFEERMKTEAEDIIEQVTDTLDQYLDYVAAEWLKENEVEVESSLRSEIAESLLAGIHEVFTSNNIRVPDAKVDVLEQLTARVEELEQELDNAVNENIELKNGIEESKRSQIFDKVAEGLVATQVEKFRTLSEGLDFADADSFEKKLGVIKEKHFNKKDATPASGVLTEENDVPLDEDDKKPSAGDPNMSRYADAISRNVKE